MNSLFVYIGIQIHRLHIIRQLQASRYYCNHPSLLEVELPPRCCPIFPDSAQSKNNIRIKNFEIKIFDNVTKANYHPLTFLVVLVQKLILN